MPAKLAAILSTRPAKSAPVVFHLLPVLDHLSRYSMPFGLEARTLACRMDHVSRHFTVNSLKLIWID